MFMLKIPESKQNYVPYSLPVRVRELDIAVSVWSNLHIADVPMQNHKTFISANERKTDQDSNQEWELVILHYFLSNYTNYLSNMNFSTYNQNNRDPDLLVSGKVPDPQQWYTEREKYYIIDIFFFLAE